MYQSTAGERPHHPSEGFAAGSCTGLQSPGTAGLAPLTAAETLPSPAEIAGGSGTVSSELVRDSATSSLGLLLHGRGQWVPKRWLNAQRKSGEVKNAAKIQLPEASLLVHAAPQHLTSMWRT